MAVRVVNGQTAGRPFLIRTLQAFSSLGMSQAGALLYQSTVETRMNLYRASFDTTSGRVGAPSRVDVFRRPAERLGVVVAGRTSAGLRELAPGQAGEDAVDLVGRELLRPDRSACRSTAKWSWIRQHGAPTGAGSTCVGSDDRGWELYRVNTESGIAEAVVRRRRSVFVSKDPRSSPPGWLVARRSRRLQERPDPAARAARGRSLVSIASPTLRTGTVQERSCQWRH